MGKAGADGPIQRETKGSEGMAPNFRKEEERRLADRKRQGSFRSLRVGENRAREKRGEKREEQMEQKWGTRGVGWGAGVMLEPKDKAAVRSKLS